MNEIVKFPNKTTGSVLGSPAAYTSVASARLGIKTGIVTKIGEDMPKNLLKPFYDAEVDTTGIKVEGKYSTTNYLIYDENGNKTLKYLKKAPPITFKDMPNSYLDSEIIHICPMDFEVPIKTLKKLKEEGVKLSVDLMGYGGATSTKHPYEDEETRKFFEEAITFFDVVRASFEDCEHIFGKGFYLNQALNFFVDKGAEIGIITLSEKGAIFLTKNTKPLKVPCFKANIVDLTGAGDVFSAGFLTEYIRTRIPLDSVIFGCAVASLVIEKTGGVLASRMPDAYAVKKRVNKNKYKLKCLHYNEGKKI
ncbi:MAG: carbohydrate kinase family protein [Asgard group archaeon]